MTLTKRDERIARQAEEKVDELHIRAGQNVRDYVIHEDAFGDIWDAIENRDYFHIYIPVVNVMKDHDAGYLTLEIPMAIFKKGGYDWYDFIQGYKYDAEMVDTLELNGYWDRDEPKPSKKKTGTKKPISACPQCGSKRIEEIGYGLFCNNCGLYFYRNSPRINVAAKPKSQAKKPIVKRKTPTKKPPVKRKASKRE